jgi:hypothetical protein
VAELRFSQWYFQMHICVHLVFLHEVGKAALQTLCRLPPDSLAPPAAEVLRTLWDSDKMVQSLAVGESKRMLKDFQAPALKEQLRRAAVDACIGDGVLGTLR